MREDLVFALRMLRKSPSVAAVAVLTLAIALGATTSIFSAVSAMLLRPLPFPDAGRLVAVLDIQPGFPDQGDLSWPELVDLRRGAPHLTGIAAWRREAANLAGHGEPQRVRTMMVSARFFELLGAPLPRGRSFSPEEETPNGPAAVLASPGFWRRALGELPLGGTLLLDGTPHTLVGVAPAAVEALDEVDLYLSMDRKPLSPDRGMHWIEAFGRLEPGVPLARAQEDLATASQRIAEAAGARHLARLRPLGGYLRGDARPLLLLLLAAVGLVLLISTVNLANLVLSRATGRAREFAVRRALGASGARLARQLLVENLVIGLAGGALGLLFTLWGRDLLVRSWPANLPRLGDAPLDVRVVLFAAALSLCAGLGVGLVPAVLAARGDLTAALKDGAGASPRSRTRSALVVAQSALAVLLLVGAGLLLESLWKMLGTSPGFRPEQTLSLRIGLPEARYPEPQQRVRFFRDLLERVAALPGVHAAGAASRVPLGGGSTSGDFTVVGRPPLDERDLPTAEKRIVTRGYFAALQIPLVKGRLLTDDEREPVVLINAALARKVFPGEEPLGRQISSGMFGRGGNATIVGVVADVKQYRLDREAVGEIYYPQALIAAGDLVLVVRGEGPLLPALRAQIAALDPDQPAAEVRTLEEVIERNAGPQRLLARLLSAFAAAALLLAALGIYGVVSFAVSRREREIGVRMALGARAGDVLRMILAEGLRLSLTGVVCGSLAALLLARLLAGFLYGVSATDPAIYLVVTLSLCLVAALASLWPARRATRVDPAIALRAE